MNKFKKACDDLAVYLNRDAKGIELLSRVTRIGNEMRKELASLSDAKARADSSCKLHMETAIKASAEASKAKAESQQYLDTIASLRCKVANYEKQTINDDDQESASLELTPREVSKLLRDAMKDRQHTLPFDKEKDVISLQKVITNLSYSELARLGRLVAVYAIMSGKSVVESIRFTSVCDENDPESDATLRLFLKFLKPKCDFSKNYRKRAMYAGSEAQPISHE